MLGPNYCGDRHLDMFNTQESICLIPCTAEVATVAPAAVVAPHDVDMLSHGSSSGSTTNATATTFTSTNFYNGFVESSIVDSKPKKKRVMPGEPLMRRRRSRNIGPVLAVSKSSLMQNVLHSCCCLLHN